jgi:hypothetical protein
VLGWQKCTAGEARFGGSGGQIFPVPLTHRSCHTSPRFSVCPASPEHHLCSGDGLEVPDTVSGCAGQNEALETGLGPFFVRRVQIPLRDTTRDALRPMARFMLR